MSDEAFPHALNRAHFELRKCYANQPTTTKQHHQAKQNGYGRSSKCYVYIQLPRYSFTGTKEFQRTAKLFRLLKHLILMTRKYRTKYNGTGVCRQDRLDIDIDP